MSQIFTTKNLLLQDVCNQILEIDNSIRFAGFANNMGTVIVAQYRQALMSVEKEKEKEKEQPLLTKDELELSVIESALRILTRKDMMSKLGKPIYSFTLYEKVGRATILLDNSNNNSGCPPILVVSFDNHDSEGPYPESIILRGILPLVSYYLRC